MFFRFCKKFVRIFGLACQFLLVASLLLLYVLPFQVVSANTSGTSGSNQGTNNQSILGTVLPACASAARGVNLFLECAKQVTLAILIVGIIFVFIRIAYQSAAGLLSGGASAASIKQIQDLLGSLIVGIVLVGMPALIIQSIDPLAGRVAFNFLQEFNLGPDARLISIDKDLDVIGCSGLQLCVNNCNQTQKGNPENLGNCVTGCKTKNSESEEPCSEECRDTIPDNGDTTQFLEECVHTVLKEPPQTQTGSSGNSNSCSGNILEATDVPLFNPNCLMSDVDFTTTRAFPDEASVQRYLDSVNSPLKNYTEQGKRASYWIFAAARGQTSSRLGVVPQLNPGLILAYLQKEQSLLTLSGYDTVNDPEFRLRKAMGYGCPDNNSCNPKYLGFVNQLNWAAYQLQLNFNQASTTDEGNPYRVNNTITTLDKYNVFLSNAATAANYRYTPHVYWGNYNLWKIMSANGWGDSSQTFSMSRIDEVNLPSRNRRPTINPNERPIALAEVYHLITRNYTLGETSSDIDLFQRFLKQQGYFMRSEITSTFGVVTQNALFAFRRDKGIIISQPSEQCRNLINRDYTFGVTSDEVKSLQQCLRELGLFDFSVGNYLFNSTYAIINSIGGNKT